MVTGYDVDGWEDSTWILHAMYELPELSTDYTHDDSHKAELATGAAAPGLLDELGIESTVTGVPLGLTTRPGLAW